MNGVQQYENTIEKRINNIIIAYPSLEGFSNYIHTKGALTTNYSYLLHITRFLNKYDKDFNQITFDDYISYLASLRQTTNGYQRCAYFALKRFSEYLVYSRKTSIDYMKDIVAPKNTESIETKEKREIGFLTKEEVDDIFENIKCGVGNDRAIAKQKEWKERDLAIMYLFLSTGIRCSAMYKLDINNIDWDDGTLIVIDKGSKVHKYVLSPKVMTALRIWMIRRNELLKGKEESALFISYRKTRLGNLGIAKIVEKYAYDIKGKHITPHKLRATFGTQLYNETRDIKFVQDQMGHSNPKTTELYIRGNRDADRQKAADIMSKFLD